MTSQASFSHQMRVGLFIAIGLVVLLSSILMVGGKKLFRSYAILHAHFENVQGLNEGSVISLTGVPIGNVEKFVFLPEENKLDVWLKIDKDYLPRITEGSAVDIRTQGALGDKFIYIIPGPATAKALQDGDKIEVLKQTDLLAVISEKSGDVTKVFEIMEELRKFTKALNNENRTDRIMKNMAESSQDFKEAAKDAREMIAQMKNQDSKKMTAAVDKLDRILTKIDRGEGTLGALINDNSLHESLKTMIGASDKKKSMKSLIRSSIEKSEKD